MFSEDDSYEDVWKFISRPNKRLIAFSYSDEGDTFSLADAIICLTPAAFLFNTLCNKYCYFYSTLNELGDYVRGQSIEDIIIDTCDGAMLERFADLRIMLRLYGAYDDELGKGNDNILMLN